ncbi:uncharacterized protein DUF5047 [Prauserella shujinwangii]|uniref:Uncharacterized protein DUF5047 n=1 Tax=Prauserella shujinwangii TaxID=1453103 RepID=A0A2T0LXE2_9PSEU|nr:DUF5047 domain-containing protein [Prauserella shujinwangii]PRX48688.1 uncharacterized protein DUF5047 [Prauserella shujinwangii]
MRPVSPKFLRVLRGSHRMRARARIVAPGQTGTDPAGVEVPILTGNVVLDATADVRATLDLITLTDWPRGAGGLVAPYGAEAFVERGLVYGNGDTEWVSQGYFRLYQTEQQDVPRGAIQLAGRDRMSGIADARLLTPLQFATGTSVREVFEYLVQEVYPTASIEFDFDADNATLTRSHIAEEKRYEFLRDLATALGKTMFWDHRGVLQVRDAPDPTRPAWEVNGGEGGVLVQMSRTLTREGVYNAVVATGEAPDTENPVRAVAWDDNPDSPTYWNGPFGKVPRFYSSPFVETVEQAKAAARALLVKSIGLPYNVDLTAIPNPALEPLDPVQVRYDSGTRAETHVLERLTLPLLATEAMTATTREQTLIRIGVT